MTDAPERIWAWRDNGLNDPGSWDAKDSRAKMEGDTEYVRADLAPVVEVKPLEWNGPFADTGLGFEYHTLISKSGKSYCLNRVRPGRDSECLGYFPTLVAAKAAAQADYEKRILSAITTRSAADVRKEALEEAAVAIEKDHGSRNTIYDKSRQDAAKTIRALIEKEGGSV